MRLRLLAAWLAVLALAPAASAQQQPPLRLDLNIPESRLVVYEGDRVLRSYPVSVGLPGHDTPTGNFTVDHAEWNPWWRPPERKWAEGEKVTPPGPNNPMGRVKLFFLPLYFIHGTPDKENIGQPASHGCVRMLNADVIALAKLLHQRAAPSVTAAQIDRILASPRNTRRVNFQTGVPFSLRYDRVVVRDGAVRVYPDVYKYGGVHRESVYQALLAAGYLVDAVDPADVQALLRRAQGAKGTLSVPVAEAFGASVASTRRGATATR